MAGYHGLPYSVRRKGVVGAPACPSDLLRRVINFARECGLDYLWIDQECIEQDDPEDKDVGIQAMDLVYQMAAQSVAVLEVRINEQSHLDALGLLQDCNVEEDLAPTDLQDLIEALEIILSDRWFERTWCLQESTSAARKMALLIRRNPALRLPDSLISRLCKNRSLDGSYTNLIYWERREILYCTPEEVQSLLRGHRFWSQMWDRAMTAAEDLHVTEQKHYGI
jgi:predicted nucleic acid-binding protein